MLKETLYKIKGTMDSMVKENTLERIGGKRHGYWHIPNKE